MSSQSRSIRRTVRRCAAVRITAACFFITAAAWGAAAAAGETAGARLREVQRQLERLQAQLQALAQENRALREHQELEDRALAQLLAPSGEGGSATHALAPPASGANGSSVRPAAAPGGASAAALPAPATAGVVQGAAEGLRLWGYGELYYADPTRERGRAQADLARAVFGIGYAFDARTEFNSEYELEHAVTSSSDVGEFEVEQFYVDRRLSDAVSARGGLLLMPFGFLNEHHEPTRFYGVQRNFVETLIIPSTWREGGFALRGESAQGIGWNVGLTTGFDLSRWSFAPQFPPYVTALGLENSHVAPLQASHQELALANARDLSQYAALSYFGVPGLLLGSAISTGHALPVPLPPGAAAGGAQRVTLWEAHARWMPARWDLSALYAHGAIGNSAAANAANPGAPNPIPSSFYGYFLQGAYDLWEQGDYRLAPFVRFERYDLGASYAATAGPAIPAGLVPLSATPGDLGHWPQNHDRVWTAGANFSLGSHLVVKGDYQWFEVNQGFRRFDLGLGLSF